MADLTIAVWSFNFSLKSEDLGQDYQGASTANSRPKVKLGFFLPFMYFAAVCESEVIRMGRAIVESQGT